MDSLSFIESKGKFPLLSFLYEKIQDNLAFYLNNIINSFLFSIDKRNKATYNSQNGELMKFEQVYEIIEDRFTNKVMLKNRQRNQILPYSFDYVDLTTLDDNNYSVVKVSIDGFPKLFDLKSQSVYKYKIKNWLPNSNNRFIAMIVASGSCAIFDCASKKMRIMPNNITDVYPSIYCEKRYCLVKVFGGEYTFYHLDKYFTLNVRYTKEEIQKLGGKLHWKDVIKRSPKDFEHLPLELAKKKNVIKECSEIFKSILTEMKEILSKDDYLKYKAELKEIFNKRLSCMPNANRSV